MEENWVKKMDSYWVKKISLPEIIDCDVKDELFIVHLFLYKYCFKNIEDRISWVKIERRIEMKEEKSSVDELRVLLKTEKNSSKVFTKEEYVEKTVKDILNGNLKLDDYVAEQFELIKQVEALEKVLYILKQC